MRLSLAMSALGVFVCLMASLADTQPDVIARLPISTRAEVIARARALAGHRWTCRSVNMRASCSARYKSDWKDGQIVTGLPYGWGKMDDEPLFDKKLAQGLAAGGHSQWGVLSCIAGIDCSGFVAYCWGLKAGIHAYTTSNLRNIAGEPKYNWFTDMRPGDALDKPGAHVVLFTGYNPDGTFNICEASGSAARVVCHATTWSRFKGYIPLQYKGIDE